MLVYNARKVKGPILKVKALNSSSISEPVASACRVSGFRLIGLRVWSFRVTSGLRLQSQD